MNAPKEPAQFEAQHLNIPLERLLPSKTNPRKRKGFDDKSLNELADSIRSVGIAQPILVRIALQSDGEGAAENKGNYEIVAGERRWRAAQRAGLGEAPVLLRNLSDGEVLKIQLIENKQREDLDELEEAEGYEKLMQQQDAEGSLHTADTIAKVMGVSRATIYARLKLLDLCQEAREAFYRGELDASTALLIARIPVHKLQIEALKEVTRKMEYSSPNLGEGDKALSYRKAREVLQERYMLDLATAPFDIKDAALVPKCGSCTDCTKRTGNQPELFDDVDGKNVCTDPVCHAMKKTAHVLALQKAAEEKGNTLLLGKAAKKLIPNYTKTPEEHLRDNGLVTLESKVPGDEQKRTFGQILKEAKLLTPAKDTGKAAVAKTIIEHPHRTNTMIETVNIEAATKALREAGFEITLKGNASPQKADDKHTKEQEKRKQEVAIENAFRSRLFDTLHAQIEADMLDPSSNTFKTLYRMLAMKLWDDLDWYDEDNMFTLLRKYTTLPNKQNDSDLDLEELFDEFGNNIPNLTPAQHLMLIIELLLLLDEISTNSANNDATTMLTLAEELDIDAAGMKKEVADEVKAEQKAKAAADKKSAAKAAAAKAVDAAFKSAQPAAPSRKVVTWPFPKPGKVESEAEPEQDELYTQAAKVVMLTQRSSISLVQRELKIGYNRAAHLIEALEKGGIVSAQKADGSRDVLKTTDGGAA